MGLFDKLKKLFSFEFNVLADAPPLSAEQSRGLALGLIYAAEGRLPINALTCEADAATARNAVAGPWDATDPESAKANYVYLLGGGHDSLYRLVNEKIVAYNADTGDRDSKTKAYVAAIAQGRAEAPSRNVDPDDFEQTLLLWHRDEATGHSDRLPESALANMPKSIVAWDAARVVQCSRLFVDAGFVTQDEAWAAIARAVAIARPAYASWKEFGEAFLVGRYFWSLRSGKKRDEAGSDVLAFAIAAEDIGKAPESPWKTIAW